MCWAIQSAAHRISGLEDSSVEIDAIEVKSINSSRNREAFSWAYEKLAI
jgi:hypothetical protein